MSDLPKETITVITGDFTEVRGSFHHHEGTNDYSNTRLDIVEIVDREGRSLEPVWRPEWTTLAAGVETRGDRGGRFLRIFVSACPVRVRFLDQFEYVSYTDSEHSSSSMREYWIRYQKRDPLLSG